MKVALITRATLFTVAGGDTIQVKQTASHLARLGVEADIKLTHEKIDYSRYDVLHFFNIIRPADILCHVGKSGKPFVVTPVLVDYTEYDTYHRPGITGVIARLLPHGSLEYLKTVVRFITGRDRLMSPAFLWKGQKRSISELLEKASYVFSNSTLEYKKLEQLYAFKTGNITVPNGIDPSLFSFDAGDKKDKNLVICAARIEGIKNQLNLIRALNNTRYTLVLIGSASPGQSAYYRQCRKIAAENILFVEHLPQEELVNYYQKAAVHVLPSWFETCGLSSLEAAAMGCNIVITSKGYTREYYEDFAFYCDPAIPKSIFNAVEKAAKAGIPEALKKKILSSYTWLQASARIAEAYHQL